MWNTQWQDGVFLFHLPTTKSIWLTILIIIVPFSAVDYKFTETTPVSVIEYLVRDLLFLVQDKASNPEDKGSLQHSAEAEASPPDAHKEEASPHGSGWDWAIFNDDQTEHEKENTKHTKKIKDTKKNNENMNSECWPYKKKLQKLLLLLRLIKVLKFSLSRILLDISCILNKLLIISE